MIFAEIRKEDIGDGYYTLRYIVYNGDIIGTYGIHTRPDGKPYGASRDYHQLATREDLTNPSDYVELLGVQPCEYHDDAMCICDGSSLVSPYLTEQEAFEYAAMMAGVSNDAGA